MFPENKQKNTKSSILWNVVDPDDPYDIRKSMIARLPDHTENFMGGNLEIVCLMQAAQIERLSDSLAQNQLKYREVERKQLDRHSYEIQIKQLSERANQASKYRIQIEKLRDYIKKLSLQLEQQSQNSSSASVLQQKYDQLYKKYQSLLLQLQNSRQNIDTLNLNIQKILEENKELRIKYDKLEKLRLTEITQQRQKYQLKIRERIQIQIKEVENRYNIKIGQLESDCRLYREQIQSKNHEIASLISRYQSLHRQLQAKQKQKSLNSQYEDKISQLQRINNTLAQKASEMQQIYNHYSNLQIRLRETEKLWRECEQQNKHYKAELEKINKERNQDEERDGRIMIQLENKTALLSQEIQRLSFIIQGKNKQINANKAEFETRNTKYTMLSQEVQRLMSVIQGKNKEISILQSRLNSNKADYETKNTKIALLGQQIQRLLSISEAKNKEMSSMQTRISATKTEYESRIRQIMSEYEQRLQLKNDQAQRIEALESELKPLRQLTIQLKLKNELLTKQLTVLSLNSKRCQDLQNQLKNADLIISQKNDQICRLQSRVKSNQSLTNQIINMRNIIAQYNRFIRGIQSLYGIPVLGREGIPDAKQLESLSKSILKTHEQKQELRKQLERQVLGNHEITNKLNQKQRELSQANDSLNKIRIQMRELKRINDQYESDIRKGTLITLSNHEAQIKKIQSEAKSSVQRQLSGQFQKVLEERQRLINDLQNENRILQQQISSLKDKIQRKNNEQQQIKTHVETRYLNQIHDLTNSLKTLREQNQRTVNQKNKLKSALNQVEKQLILKQKQYLEANKDLTRKLEQSKNNSELLQRDLSRFKQELISSQEMNNRAQIQAEERAIKMFSAQLQDKDSSIASLERQLKNSKDELRSIQQFDQKARNDIKNYRDRLLKASEQLDRLNEILIGKNNQISNLNEKINSIEQNYKRQLIQKDEQLKRIINERNNENNLRKDLQDKQQQNRNLKSHLANIQNLHKRHLQQKQTQVQTPQSQISPFQNEIKSLQSKLQPLQSQILTLQSSASSFQSLRRQLDERNREVSMLSSELKNMKGRGQEDVEKERKQFKIEIQNIEGKYQRVLREKDQQIEKERAQKGLRLAHERDLIQKALRVQYQATIKQYTERQSKITLQYSNLHKIYEQTSRQLMEIKKQYSFLLERSKSFDSQKNQRESALEIRITQQQYEIKNLKQMFQQLQQISAHTLTQRDTLLRTSYQLQSEIERYKTIIRDGEKNETVLNRLKDEVNRLNQSLYQCEGQKRAVETSLEECLRKCREYEDKLAMTVSQIQRLNQLINQRNRQLSVTKHQTQTTQTLQKQVQSLRQMLSKKEEIQRMYKEQQIQLQNLKQMLEQMQQINLHTTAERDELFQISHKYKLDIDGLEQRLLHADRNRGVSQQSYEELTASFNLLKAQNLELRDKGRKFEAHFDGLAHQNRMYQDRIKELIVEMERLGLLIVERERDSQSLSEMQQRIQQLEIQLQQSREWQQKYRQLYQTHIDYTKNYQKKAQENQRAYEEIVIKVKQLLQERQLLMTRIKIIDELVQKNKILGAEIDRLNIVITDLRKQLEDTRQRLGNQMALQRRIQEDLGLMVVMFAEIQTMRNRLSQSQLQCENIRRSSLTPHRVDRQIGRSLDSRPR